LCSFDPGTGEPLWTVDGLTVFLHHADRGRRNALLAAVDPERDRPLVLEAAFTQALDLSDAEIADPALIFKRLDKNADGKIVPDEVPECRMKDVFGFLDRDLSGAWELGEVVHADTLMPTTGENLMVAVSRGASGNATKDHVRWSWKRGLPYVSSPLWYHGRVWLLQAGGLVTAIDATTGKPIIDRARLPDRTEYYLSPVGAAGHVLAGSAEGSLYVLAADAPELVVEQTVAFDEELFATPAVLDGVNYVRTKTALWAFGERKE
jgi:outer membrane protein assembly factor BamB